MTLTLRMTVSSLVSVGMLLLGAGCATSKTVRLETGQGDPVVITPRNVAGKEFPATGLDEATWKAEIRKQARTAKPFVQPLREARELFGIPPLSGLYGFDRRNKRLIGLNAETRSLHLNDPDEQLAKDYLHWCERGGRPPGDCLGILENGVILGSEAKLTLALAIGMGSVWDGTEAELRSLTSGRAIAATIISTVAMYFTLWVMPEPVSKGVAAILSVVAIAYLGFDTFVGFMDGWSAMVLKSDAALTFGELRKAGAAFGKVLGVNGARFFVMMATAAMGRTAAELAAKAPTLPGFESAALSGEAQAGIELAAAVETVESVAVTVEGVTITLAPHAVAMAAERITRPARPRQMPDGDATQASKNVSSGAKRVTGEELEKLRAEFDDKVKPKFWKNEAETNPGKYTEENLARMKQGNPPKDSDGVSLELHHKVPLAEGGTNDFSNLEIMTRAKHRLGPNYKLNHPNLP